MSEAIPTNGFALPPTGAPAASLAQAATPPANAQPGWVANPGGQAASAPGAAVFTQGQLDAQIAIAVAAAQAKATPAVPVEPVLPGQTHGITTTPAPSTFASGSDDAVLNSLTDVFSKVGTGIDLDRAIGQALTYGNPALIDSKYLAEKGGAFAEQLTTLANAIVQRVTTEAARATSDIHNQAGGKQAWDVAATAFNATAPAHLKTVIAQMLDSGNREAVQAAAKSVVDFSKGSGLVPQPAQLLNAGSANVGATALSKEEFQTAHSKLDMNSRTYNTDRAALYAGRAMGKQLGK